MQAKLCDLNRNPLKVVPSPTIGCIEHQTLKDESYKFSLLILYFTGFHSLQCRMYMENSRSWEGQLGQIMRWGRVGKVGGHVNKMAVFWDNESK